MPKGIFWRKRAMVKERKKAWEEERVGLMREREQLIADVNHYKTTVSVSTNDVETLYAELGIVQDDNQKLASELHWWLSQGFQRFLAAFTQSPNFKSSLEKTYQAYWNVRCQAGLEDESAFSSQGLERKKTPHYNSKAKK
ncbi:hypothetical protein HanOQP8_Chr09g0333631 [Helianthus annuus]|nr:hypothetical protein HanOQP8_Chr09g0333631 [Helianthus annuus]